MIQDFIPGNSLIPYNNTESYSQIVYVIMLHNHEEGRVWRVCNRLEKALLAIAGFANAKRFIVIERPTRFKIRRIFECYKPDMSVTPYEFELLEFKVT